MFRGVPSEEHGLLPSAHRRGARLLTPDLIAVAGPMDTLRTQCGAEFYTLERFFNIASRHGVHMPEDSYLLREQLEDWRIVFQQNEDAAYEERIWPSAEMYSLVALAQHYGVPTRALDWTYSAHTAAYFAARPALESAGECIAVWAVDDFHRQVDRVLATTPDRPLRIFTVSGAENENLRAQRGLFMLHPQKLAEPFSSFRPVNYNVLLIDSVPLLKQAVYFVRVLVAASEAANVLALLAAAGITRGALHPGLSGVAAEFRDEDLIPRRASRAGGHTLETIGLWDRIHDAAKPRGA